MKVVELENAIARLQIKILAVELAAMLQPASEGLLRHSGVENLALDIVDGGILRMTGNRKIKGQNDGRQRRLRHDKSMLVPEHYASGFTLGGRA